MALRGMGPNVAARQVTVTGITGSMTAIPEDGIDRSIFDTDFGHHVEAHLKELLDQASDLLQKNRWFVLAVAHALETHKTITGDDIEAIYRGTKGLDVDGWIYHTDHFLISYEAYHLALLDAHKNSCVPIRRCRSCGATWCRP